MSADVGSAPPIDYAHDLLVTDLYELNMAVSYYEAGMTDEAVFEFFVRTMPADRGFLIAAGLEQALRFVLEARIAPEGAAWLRRSGRFPDWFVRRLEAFRFSGDVDAVPEGTVVFPDEPLLRVTAPLPDAQILETRLVNFLHFQTMVATKAARTVLAAPEASLVDFGLRRAHAGEAGVLAARAARIAGFAGTATVPAGPLFDIPLFGTMAHSYVQAHATEADAFRDFARARPDQTTFLIDTYDTEDGARAVAAIAPELEAAGLSIRGVRLDSGDLAAHAVAVRGILDRAGLAGARIVASGGIDEHVLAACRARGAPIDAFGVGTSLATCEDAPALDCAYKLKAYADRPTRKRSEGKAYWPGPTEAYRALDGDGRLAGDHLTTADDDAPAADGARRLLAPVVRRGRLVARPPDLDTIRAHAARELARLPEGLRALRSPERYPVTVSDRLVALAERVDAEIDRGSGAPRKR